MTLEVTMNEATYRVLLDKAASLAIGFKESPDNVRCFYAPYPHYEPVKMGDWVGSVRAGSPVNFYNVFINPHGNGTHTECVGHISAAHHIIHGLLKTVLCPVQVVSVYPTLQENGDRVITKDTLESVIDRLLPVEAVVLRTLPNHNSKMRLDYSGSNPAYLHHKAATWLRDIGVDHLLLDLPSVDREEDSGQLLAHKAFWQYPESPRLHATITELIFVPDTIADGLYLLNMQIAPLDLDASPANPVLLPLERV
jgi:kynurenine formamidase